MSYRIKVKAHQVIGVLGPLTAFDYPSLIDPIASIVRVLQGGPCRRHPLKQPHSTLSQGQSTHFLIQPMVL